MSREGIINGQYFEFPHCNADVLHAPGTCHYCDAYPNRQALRAAGGTPFTPSEANGWSGNVAVQEGEVHTHLGATYVVGSRPPPDRSWTGTTYRSFRRRLRDAMGLS